MQYYTCLKECALLIHKEKKEMISTQDFESIINEILNDVWLLSNEKSAIDNAIIDSILGQIVS